VERILTKCKGQGVIEYAGALVIAVFIMSIAFTSLPEGAYAFFVDMQEQILAFLQGEVESL